MSSADEGVLLVDWENLAGAILDRGKMVDRSQVDDLWEFASRRCGERLHRAHMAAAKFDPSIVVAMRDHMITAEPVRSTKEQADILLTVLAMDYLYKGVGHFFLVTGDQDFIPLISRLHAEGRKVTVVYGDKRRLSPELLKVLMSPGLDSIDIADVSTLRERKSDTGCRSLIALLELQRRGFILGGKEKGERTSILSEWGIIENTDENHYWSLINTLAEKVERPDAAVRDRDQWVPKVATRTYLKLGNEQLADVVAVDHAVRWLSARTRALTLSAMRTGPFRTDAGALLDRALDALVTVQRIRKEADQSYSLLGPRLQMGYLEQLWRVYAGIMSECYRRRTATFAYNQLESLLIRRGIGQGGRNGQESGPRDAGRIRESVNYAKAVGVLDVVAVNGQRHVIAPHSPLSRLFEQAYHALYSTCHDRLDQPIGEEEVFSLMESMDEVRAVPYFGFDLKDRQRFLRILSQSFLATWRDGHVVLSTSGWGEAGQELQR